MRLPENHEEGQQQPRYSAQKTYHAGFLRCHGARPWGAERVLAVLRNASCRVHLYSCPPALRLPSHLSIPNLHGLVLRTADEVLAVAAPPCSLEALRYEPASGADGAEAGW